MGKIVAYLILMLVVVFNPATLDSLRIKFPSDLALVIYAVFWYVVGATAARLLSGDGP